MKKSYIDSRTRRNFGSINTELQDVQRIMVANIEEVLQRGEALSGKYTWLTYQLIFSIIVI
jgi:vesicle transport protein SEC22